MKVAIVGAGVSGLTAALELQKKHEVHLFEAATRAGGHAHTVVIDEDGKTFPVDMGFIVFNRKNYPVFSEVLDQLEVPSTPSCMGFSVSDPQSGLEYSGESFPALFAAPRNALDVGFWRMLRDFRRFCRLGQISIREGFSGDVDSFANRFNLSDDFLNLFLRPMAGAIWSTPLGEIGRFPAATLLRFFERHGLLSVTGRPDWLTIPGGSQRYVEALLGCLDVRVHLGQKVERVERDKGGVRLAVAGNRIDFDQVVLALHSDQALRLLADASPQEREILGAIRYRANDVVLHRDRSLLPSRPRAWTSWNVRIQPGDSDLIAVTYLMNKLQSLPTTTPWCVSLNQTETIDPSMIRAQMQFAHPQFDAAAINAQDRWSEISGVRGTHFCGAYWRYGFHEDGAWSGRRVARHGTFTMGRAA